MKYVLTESVGNLFLLQTLFFFPVQNIAAKYGRLWVIIYNTPPPPTQIKPNAIPE